MPWVTFRSEVAQDEVDAARGAAPPDGDVVAAGVPVAAGAAVADAVDAVDGAPEAGLAVAACVPAPAPGALCVLVLAGLPSDAQPATRAAMPTPRTGAATDLLTESLMTHTTLPRPSRLESIT